MCDLNKIPTLNKINHKNKSFNSYISYFLLGLQYLSIRHYYGSGFTLFMKLGMEIFKIVKNSQMKAFMDIL